MVLGDTGNLQKDFTFHKLMPPGGAAPDAILAFMAASYNHHYGYVFVKQHTTGVGLLKTPEKREA